LHDERVRERAVGLFRNVARLEKGNPKSHHSRNIKMKLRIRTIDILDVRKWKRTFG
jgi:hypothetical protein